MTDAGRLAALGAHELDVARVQRALAFHDPALDVLLRIRLRVPLDDVHAFDDEAVLHGEHFQHSPALAAVLPGRHHDLVVSAYRRLQCRHRSIPTLYTLHGPRRHRGAEAAWLIRLCVSAPPWLVRVKHVPTKPRAPAR